MAIQFYNINKALSKKTVSIKKHTDKTTTVKRFKKRLTKHKLTKENLAFLKSLGAI